MHCNPSRYVQKAPSSNPPTTSASSATGASTKAPATKATDFSGFGNTGSSARSAQGRSTCPPTCPPMFSSIPKSLIELVGAGRFELPTPCSRSKGALAHEKDGSRLLPYRVVQAADLLNVATRSQADSWDRIFRARPIPGGAIVMVAGGRISTHLPRYCAARLVGAGRRHQDEHLVDLLRLLPSS